ncbi:hypothetical protein LMIY3S_03046 [Labrys miyagiensis]
MFFILRMVFWIAVVALLLPAAPGPRTQSASASTTSLTDRAVSAAISYCAASPDKCAAGLEGARKIGELLAGKSEPADGSAPSVPQRVVTLPPPRPAIP